MRLKLLLFHCDLASTLTLCSGSNRGWGRTLPPSRHSHQTQGWSTLTFHPRSLEAAKVRRLLVYQTRPSLTLQRCSGLIDQETVNSLGKDVAFGELNVEKNKNKRKRRDPVRTHAWVIYRGGWKLVISDAHRIAIGATWWCNPLRLIVKCAIDLHNSSLACLERNSLNGCCQVSSRSLAVILRYKWSIRAVPLKSPQTTLCIKNVMTGDLELTWQYPLGEFCSKTVRTLLRKPISHFTVGLIGSSYDYIIM